MAGTRIQEGIYWSSGQTPKDQLRLVFLNFRRDAAAPQADRALSLIWSMLEDLKQGTISDLKKEAPDEPDFSLPPGDELTTMLGFGRRLFDKRSHISNDWPSSDKRPAELGRKLLGGKDDPFDNLKWHPAAFKKRKNGTSLLNEAQSDIVLQFIATNELAVNRAIVELMKLISDRSLPLEITTFVRGHHRKDRRSWIDFHDGINNLSVPDRAIAMEITNQDQPWLTGGTSMTFLQIAVDLEPWRQIPRTVQELIVGRKKLTGCPILQTEVQGGNVSMTTADGCPMTGNLPDDLPLSFLEPGNSSDELIQVSHIHRANQQAGSPTQPSARRIYRQGYEFLDIFDGDVTPGLNFISFQKDNRLPREILDTPNWLKEVNFGGPDKPKTEIGLFDVKFLSLLRGGVFVVPPKSKPYPGAPLFRSQLDIM